MTIANVSVSNSVLRNLPSVDQILRSGSAVEIAAHDGTAHAGVLVRRVIDDLRGRLGGGSLDGESKQELLDTAEASLRKIWELEQSAGKKRVINATGVVIHTNLGRAPLSEAARRAVADEAAGYCNLEYDIEAGKRGRRGGRAEDMLSELTGAEAVLIVNNCAAAAFFVLTVFGGGGEVVVSRGELVEIGGDFRVPDVLSQSGATLREVGTTNRTKLADYEKAISEKTRVILRVHPSNYKIIGFTATPQLADLAELAHKHGLLFFEDIGSGALIDLSRLGLNDEPIVSALIAAGADVVTFSGDKLLGGPQAGVIAGRREVIDRLRRHPLFRTLRADKLVYAALEATLDSYRRGAEFDEIPVLRMMSLTKDQIAVRVARFAQMLNEQCGDISNLKFETSDGFSAIGGGAAPAVQLETRLIALSHKKLPTSRLEHILRNADPPVIARIVDDRVVIDLRTVAENNEAAELLGILLEIAGRSELS